MFVFLLSFGTISNNLIYYEKESIQKYFCRKFINCFFSSVEEGNVQHISFCLEGSGGSCVPREDGNGFDCKQGGDGNDCRGTTLINIRTIKGY